MNTNLQKYLKYKSKYLDLKNELQLQVGGSNSFLYGGAIKDDTAQIKEFYDILEQGLPNPAAPGTTIAITVDKIEHIAALKKPDGSLQFPDDEVVDLIKNAVYAYHALKVALGDITQIDTIITDIQNNRIGVIPGLQKDKQDCLQEIQNSLLIIQGLNGAIATQTSEIANLKGQLAAVPAAGAPTAEITALNGTIANLQTQLATANTALAAANTALAALTPPVLVPGPPGGGPPGAGDAAAAAAAAAAVLAAQVAAAAGAGGTVDTTIANISSLLLVTDTQFSLLFPQDTINDKLKVTTRVTEITQKLKTKIPLLSTADRETFINNLSVYVIRFYQLFEHDMITGRVRRAVLSVYT